MLTAVTSESSTLCSIDQCATPFDVHCFHCRMNMCSHHYIEHKQQQETSINKSDDAMDELLQRASSKYFCISNNGYSISKYRRKYPNPFVSSSYLLKIMKKKVIHPSDDPQELVQTKKTAVKIYNLRKRPGRQQRKLISQKSTTVKFCRTVIKTALRNNKLCNRKLPCPYHKNE